MSMTSLRKGTARIVTAMVIIGTMPGCTPKQREAAADTTSTGGQLLVATPHPVARIVGLVLVFVGESAKLVLSYVDGDGTVVKQEIELSPEQLQQVREKGIVVKSPDGEKVHRQLDEETERPASTQ